MEGEWREDGGGMFGSGVDFKVYIISEYIKFQSISNFRVYEISENENF